MLNWKFHSGQLVLGQQIFDLGNLLERGEGEGGKVKSESGAHWVGALTQTSGSPEGWEPEGELWQEGAVVFFEQEPKEKTLTKRTLAQPTLAKTDFAKFWAPEHFGANWPSCRPSPIAYPVSKQLSTLLRNGHLPREEDGASGFWRLKNDLRNEFAYSQHWSDDVWKSKMAGGGGNK